MKSLALPGSSLVYVGQKKRERSKVRSTANAPIMPTEAELNDLEHMTHCRLSPSTLRCAQSLDVSIGE